ncbi:MAG: CpsD/CapB family tyrosine-protein kinase [Oscillospiraceae bacterium]|jgi:capsular exopolysaccharide synthesis family protein|nr:CpsD/CapB family tyrosine-protein kinase [Oscillospiraceae bacterium]
MSNGKKKSLLGEHTSFVITEAYKTARTNLMFSLSTSERKIVVITSSNPSEGKSTTCSNLGLTLAGMGASTLVIDADLRKPTIHALFNIPNKKGLSTILGGFDKIDDAINYNVEENLDIITSGPIPPNPADLLASDLMDSLLKALSKHYDYILIDTPPINVVTDSQLMNKIISGILFVVWEGVTTHTDISAALRSVEMTSGKVLGFIKANCNAKGAKNYKKNYKYSYGRQPKKIKQGQHDKN